MRTFRRVAVAATARVMHAAATATRLDVLISLSSPQDRPGAAGMNDESLGALSRLFVELRILDRRELEDLAPDPPREQLEEELRSTAVELLPAGETVVAEDD